MTLEHAEAIRHSDAVDELATLIYEAGYFVDSISDAGRAEALAAALLQAGVSLPAEPSDGGA